MSKPWASDASAASSMEQTDHRIMDHPATIRTLPLFALGLIYEAECHQRQKDRQDDAHQTKQAGSQGVEHPAEHALHPEPFRSAEHYRENHQNKTCDITSVLGQDTHHRRRLDRVHDLGLAGTCLARGPFAAGFRIGRCCSCHNGHDFTHGMRHDMALPRIAHIF